MKENEANKHEKVVDDFAFVLSAHAASFHSRRSLNNTKWTLFLRVHIGWSLIHFSNPIFRSITALIGMKSQWINCNISYKLFHRVNEVEDAFASLFLRKWNAMERPRELNCKIGSLLSSSWTNKIGMEEYDIKTVKGNKL